jgi:hypothetical protein
METPAGDAHNAAHTTEFVAQHQFGPRALDCAPGQINAMLRRVFWNMDWRCHPERIALRHCLLSAGSVSRSHLPPVSTLESEAFITLGLLMILKDAMTVKGDAVVQRPSE